VPEAPTDGLFYVRQGSTASWQQAPVASSTIPTMAGTAAIGVSVTYARADHVHPTDTTRAALASPIFTGVPSAPTASPGTSSAQIATCAFVAASALVQGAFKNLTVSVPSNTTVQVTADAVVLSDGTNYARALSINATAATGTVGPNGLDAGPIQPSTWYAVWVIQNTSTLATAVLLSTSASAPAMPGGYAKNARVGYVITDPTASPGSLLKKTLQRGRRVQYVNTNSAPNAGLPIMASGVHGTAGVGTLFAVAVSPFVPPTASSLRAVLSNGNLNSVSTALAPNNSYGTIGSSNPPVFGMTSFTPLTGEIMLESANIYYYGDGATAAAQCLGWDDNL
jgi:hypothetical protein